VDSTRPPAAALGGRATTGARRGNRRAARVIPQCSTISPDEERNQADAIRKGDSGWEIQSGRFNLGDAIREMQSGRCNPGDATTGLPQGFPQGFHRASTGLPQTYLLDDACHQGARWESRAIRGEARETRRKVPDEGCHHEVSSEVIRGAARCLPERHALGFVRGTRVRPGHSGSSFALGFVRGTRVRPGHSGSSFALGFVRGTRDASGFVRQAPVQGALGSVGLGAVCRVHDAVGRQRAARQHAVQTASSGGHGRRAAPSTSAFIIVDQMLGAKCPRCLTCQVRNACGGIRGKAVAISGISASQTQSYAIIRKHTQSGAIRRNQAQSKAHRSMRPRAE